MKKQFNLQDWLKDKSQKVETRSGLPVRIICWDRRGERPLVVLIQHPNGYDEGLFYYENGLANGVGQESDSDLFLVTPEPELTEFEKKLSDVFGYAISMSVSDPKKPTDEFVREYAPELLSLARKKLQPEIDAEIEKAYKTADEVQYKKGREDLLQELFKDSSTEELEKELKIFHDIFKNKDCSASAIRNWAQLFRTVAQKEYFVKTNLTASETIKEAIRTEYEKGRADVLKDLPRWEKCPLYFEHGDIGKTNKDEDILSYQGYSILLSDLAKLPKEDSHE